MVQNFIRSIDVLGPSMGFKINRQDTFKSSIGGLFTLFFGMLSVGVFLGFGRDLFSRENPAVMFNKLINENPVYQISYLNFLFAVYDQSSDKPFEELDRKFYSYIDYYDWPGDGTRTSKRYYLERCSTETIKKWDGYFKNVKSNYFCLPKNVTLDIKGIYNEGKYTSLRLQIDFCKNNTNLDNDQIKTDCYSRDFIENNITGRIQMHYLLESVKIDNKNYSNPGSAVVVSDTVNTNTNSWNRLKIFFKNIEIKTDKGFLVDDWESQILNSVDDIFSETVYTYGTNTIFSHLIGNSKYKDIFTRSYIKIQNIFALMGGFINAATLIFKYLIQYFCYPKLIDIFNNTYKYKALDPVKDPHFSSKILQEVGTKANLINNFTLSSVKPVSLSLLWKEKEKQNYSLNFKAYYRICLPCFSGGSRADHTRKLRLYDQIKKKYEKVLSIENFFKMTREIKFYKFFFLGEFGKKILKVCSIPEKKMKSENLNINFYESEFAAALEKSKCEKKLNSKILEYFINKNS